MSGFQLGNAESRKPRRLGTKTSHSQTVPPTLLSAMIFAFAKDLVQVWSVEMYWRCNCCKIAINHVAMLLAGEALKFEGLPTCSIAVSLISGPGLESVVPRFGQDIPAAVHESALALAFRSRLRAWRVNIHKGPSTHARERTPHAICKELQARATGLASCEQTELSRCSSKE